MAHATQLASSSTPEEIQRVREQLAARLLNLGIHIHTHDSADGLGILSESVEAFEAAVEARGGDLMLDEPPHGKRAQPDDPSFVLPVRASNETAHAYASRIDALTAKLRT